MAGNDVYKVIYLLCLPVYMAKLYWRVKKNGRWTWTPATNDNTLWCISDPEQTEYLGDEEE